MLTTKEVLAKCLKERMKSKPLDKITILELTKQAEVNRQTFYYHFEDIFDLLKWTVENEATTLLKNRKHDQLWNEGVLELLHYLDENREFAINAINSLGPDEFKRFFYRDVAQVINDFIYTTGDVLKEDEQYVEFLTHHFTISLAGIAITWVKGDIPFSAEETVQMIDRVLNEQMIGSRLLTAQREKDFPLESLFKL